MRGLTRTIAAAKPSAAVFSTFSGAGRGRGRGLVPSSTTTPNPPSPSPFDSPPPAGHGRGRGLPSPSSLPSFPSFSPLPSAGRGRGLPLPPPDPDAPKQPIFFRREEKVTTEVDDAPVVNRPLNLSFGVPPAGRGKERRDTEGVESRPVVDNRHLRRRPEGTAGRRGVRTGRGGRGRGLESEEGGFDLGDGVGRGGKGKGVESEWGQRITRGRGGRTRGGRGRGGRLQPLKNEVDLKYEGLDLGDPATGNKLTERLGEEEAKDLKEMMTEDISYKVLPCPQEEAYKDAVSMNYRV